MIAEEWRSMERSEDAEGIVEYRVGHGRHEQCSNHNRNEQKVGYRTTTNAIGG